MVTTAARAAFRFSRNRLANLKTALAGQPLTLPSLSSMTLDHDDVNVARTWLRHPERWRDEEPVREFERTFASWNGSEHAFAFAGGRVALGACIDALEFKRGDQILLPGYTCVVVVNAFDHAGVDVSYCDIELGTFGLDIEAVERRVNKNTRAIVIQHLYGLVSRDYADLLEFARRRSLRVIEDCAHSTGAEYKGRKVGNYGDVAFYSSEQSKVFNTIQGGLAVTNDSRLAARLQTLRAHARRPSDAWTRSLLQNVPLNYYQCKHSQRWWLGEVSEVLYGRRRLVSTTPEEERGQRTPLHGCGMAAPVAALGLNQLRKVDAYNEQRRRNAVRWRDWCVARGYSPAEIVPESQPVFLRYPVLVEPERKRDTSWTIKELGVAPGLWFVTNTHPAQRVVQGCPNADLAVRRCINLPCLL